MINQGLFAMISVENVKRVQTQYYPLKENKDSQSLFCFYFDQKDCLKINNLSMAYRKSNSPFFTPDRKDSHEKVQKGLSTTIGSRFSRIQHLHQSPGHQLRSNADGQSGQNEVKAEKNSQRRPEIINTNEQINENLQSSQGGGPHLPNDQQLELREEEDSGLMLREIGSKVLRQIKENSRLRRSANSQKARQVRTPQKSIHSVVQRASTSPPVPLSKNEIEDNPYMKDYIQKTNRRKAIISSDHSRESSVKKGLSQKKDSKKIAVTPEPKAPLFNEQLLSVQRLQNLKKYFTLYVNTAIESNDDKFAAEQKYIETLEKRLARLQHFEQALDHFNFQKGVQLQESNRKSKNLSIAGPIVKGDPSENVSISEQTPPAPVQHNPSYKYFPSNERIKIVHDPELLGELTALREENKNLKELYQIVKYNFQREIADHIRDNSEREHLVYRIQKLEAQNSIIREQSKIKKGSYATNT